MTRIAASTVPVERIAPGAFRWISRAAGLGACTLLTVSMVACGASSTGVQPSSGSAASVSPVAIPESGSGAARPGVSGLIAAVDGKTMQVQGEQAQTAVSWTTATALARQTTGTIKDLKVGTCVTAAGAAASLTAESATAATSGAGSPGADGAAARPGDVTQLTATDIRITAADKGRCDAAGGGGGRGGDGAPPIGRSAPPDALPSGVDLTGGSAGGGARQTRPFPREAPDAQGVNFGPVVSGTVTAISGSRVTVALAAGSAAAGMVTVTVSSSTTYTTTVTVEVSAIKEGLCAFATGKADTTGAVAATAIELSTPIDGACARAGIRTQGGRPNVQSTPVVTSG